MQGFIRNEYDGPNVYENVLKDYVKEVKIIKRFSNQYLIPSFIFIIII